MTTIKPSEPHPFTISDKDLFFNAEPTTKDVRTVSCCVCGDQPGQGVHKPPPPPLHAVLIDEIAKTLASTMAISWDALRPEAARAAFTAVQRVRARLKEMSKNSFYDIDAELDELLTELRKIGWDR